MSLGAGITKLGYRPEEAAAVLGSGVLLDECVAAGWIKPVVQRRKLTIYDFSALAKCWARICRGEMPGPVPRKARKVSGSGFDPACRPRSVSRCSAQVSGSENVEGGAA